MDAERLGLPDHSFDVVVAQYVITAVPHPEATLDEFARVLKPGGEIILVNHIGAETGLRRVFEQGFAPVARQLGWRPEFPWGRLAGWVERAQGFRLIERSRCPRSVISRSFASARTRSRLRLDTLFRRSL
jgi:phosphatidylethanolamine/phosphatidyl-N-methylethanolamine N-methyltransferase